MNRTAMQFMKPEIRMFGTKVINLPKQVTAHRITAVTNVIVTAAIGAVGPLH